MRFRRLPCLGFRRAAELVQPAHHAGVAQRRAPLANNELWFSNNGVKVEFDELDGLVEPLAWYQEPEKKDGK